MQLRAARTAAGPHWAAPHWSVRSPLLRDQTPWAAPTASRGGGERPSFFFISLLKPPPPRVKHPLQSLEGAFAPSHVSPVGDVSSSEPTATPVSEMLPPTTLPPAALREADRTDQDGRCLVGNEPIGEVVARAGGDVHIEPRYRQFPELTRSQVVWSELLSGFMWFWILWHFWHSSDSVLGHFPYPDSSAWTDEELGIPPDDAE
ncbi:NADH dehydrogenase [ubiquinone] 1 beta subcomplex subunit 2, mitochondrial isoform X1 [Phasianus colchicus]|uniref:NADH dehydrogenase [ubiquinone] 1 beta subcomplex subunit 2, mitochondrial n=1 Tax=Phasianus colchicus TaxID=9054 RepID=A0A669PBI1_PHACC|nr:NADH dehydrogenase [ubiquinone] 1 beta subcomplex subunit 2, mitochondrial isoform X1 [Phasianus colchicus]